jgi:hypothetical protein
LLTKSIFVINEKLLGMNNKAEGKSVSGKQMGNLKAIM